MLQTLPDHNHASPIPRPNGFEYGRWLWSNGKRPTNAQAQRLPGIFAGFNWQAGFDHAFHGKMPKLRDGNYRDGYNAGAAAKIDFYSQSP